jgi:hypothetical protein
MVVVTIGPPIAGTVSTGMSLCPVEMWEAGMKGDPDAHPAMRSVPNSMGSERMDHLRRREKNRRTIPSYYRRKRSPKSSVTKLTFTRFG